MIYKSSSLHTALFTLIGIGLCIGGCVCARAIINEIQNPLAATIFILMDPAPLMFFGLYIAIDAIRFKVVLLPDSIKIYDGIYATKTIRRDEITEYCINDKSTQLELMLKSPLKKYTVPSVITLDSNFKEWFKNTNKIPEFKESKSFDADIYPRVYKPEAEKIFFCVAICFIMFGWTTQVLMQSHWIFNPYNYKFWLISVSLVALILLCFYQIIITIGYRVTLMPDVIEVTNIIGTRSMLRSAISSYYFRYGGGKSPIPDRVTFISKDTDNKTFTIPINFDRDQEFNDWVMSLTLTPLTLMPFNGVAIPKVRDH
jgi:hypothetical protein